MFNTASGLNVGQIDLAFSRKGFKNWSTSTTKFKKHQNSISHNFSMKAYHNSLNCKPIDVTLDESRALAISEREKQRLLNRNIMHLLIDITLCLAKYGKPFRGHSEKKSDVCKGLFLDIVDILKKYDPTLYNHIQNDLLSSINNVMKRSIEKKNKQSSCHDNGRRN